MADDKKQVMDKFNLHESLRIYLPGLFICVLMYFTFNCTLKDIGGVAIPAIFIGILVDASLRWIHKKYFMRLADRRPMAIGNMKLPINEAIRKAIAEQLVLKEFDTDKQSNKMRYWAAAKRLNEYDHEQQKQLKFIYVNLHNRSYSSEKLLLFRAPKSFGILCFNLSILSMFSAVLIGLNQYFHTIDMYEFEGSHLGYLYPFLIFLAGILFFLASRHFFLRSLEMELSFWTYLSDDDLHSIPWLIKLCDRLEVGQ